ncbi:MAG: DinB family protein [Phycisphaerales bacterium]
MDFCRTYEYLCRARARLLEWVRPLSPEQYERAFAIGPGSLARVLTHILISEWYYVERLLGNEVPAYDQWAIRDEAPPAFDALERAWSEQAVRTRGALAMARDWDATLEYQVTDDDGVRIVVTATPRDIATQLVLHEVHHRAQAMNMLRQMGVKAEDLDYNLMVYGRRPA